MEITLETAELPRPIGEVTPRDMLPMGGPVYDPPYETPLEDELAWHLVKYLHRGTALHSQVRVPTPCGTFWVDFVIEHKGRRIAIECGALGEPVDVARQRQRDALIVGSGAFDVLYRVRGEDLFYHMEDVLYLLSVWHAGYFTERAAINLDRLATPEVRAHAHAVPARGPRVTIAYAPDAGASAEAQTPMQLNRFRLKYASDWVRPHDAALAEYGTSTPYARSA